MNDKLCPVCAFEMADGPRNYNICPSCGTEFGLHDENATIKELRAWWLSTGPRWHSTVVPQPSGWNPTMQLLKGTTLNARIPISISYVIGQTGITGFQRSLTQTKEPLYLHQGKTHVLHRERTTKRKLSKGFVDSISNVFPYAATFHAVVE